MRRRTEAKRKLAALLAAGGGSVLVATVLAPTTAANAAPAPSELSVAARADGLRTQFAGDGLFAEQRADSPLQLAWWGNWHNGGWSPYWHNWPNWRNWHNWGNGWGNGGCLPF